MKIADETKLYEVCSEQYRMLQLIFDEKTDIGYKEAIYKMFTKMGGRAYCKVYERCLSYSGSVKDYTFSGFIMNDSINGDYERLIEDLVRCYYVQHGGANIANTPKLFELLRSEYL